MRLMLKSEKNVITTMILALSLLQVAMFAVAYRINDPKEFASMIHQVATNNTMRLDITILVLFIFIAGIIVSTLLVSAFGFLGVKFFEDEDFKYDFQRIFLIFMMISSVQPAISAIKIPFLGNGVPIAYIVAFLIFCGLLIYKTHRILKPLLLSLLLIGLQLLIIFFVKKGLQ